MRNVAKTDIGTWNAAGGDHPDCQNCVADQVMGRLMAGQAPASTIMIDADEYMTMPANSSSRTLHSER